MPDITEGQLMVIFFKLYGLNRNIEQLLAGALRIERTRLLFIFFKESDYKT